jgi:hypothetical protein
MVPELVVQAVQEVQPVLEVPVAETKDTTYKTDIT